LPKYLEGLPYDAKESSVEPGIFDKLITNILSKFPNVFTNSNIPGVFEGVEVEIELDNYTPWVEHLRPCPPADKIELKKVLDKYLELGIIRPSTSPYATRCMLVRKASGRHQLAVCLNTLNSRTVKNTYPLPLLRGNLECMANAKYFSSLDLCQAYHSMKLKEEHKKYFAFITHHGLFEYQRACYGWVNSGPIFYSQMDRLFCDLKWDIVALYADDILIFSKTIEDHFKDIYTVLTRLKGLHLSTAKCLFFRTHLTYLGFIISKEGIIPSPNNVEKIKNAVVTNTRQVRSFLGMCGFYRRWIQNFGGLVKPLTEYVTKGSPSEITKEMQEIVSTLKQKLSEEPILGHPDFDRPWFLETDASKVAMAGILFQKDKEKRRIVIGYASQAFKTAEQEWPAHERECYAAAYAMNYFRHYLIGRKFTLLVDSDMIKHIVKKPPEGTRLYRWYAQTQDFEFKVEHVPGDKHYGPDFLSRQPGLVVDTKTRNYQKMKYLSLLEQIPENTSTPLKAEEFKYEIWLENQEKDPWLGKLLNILRKEPSERTPVERQNVQFYTLSDGLVFYKPPNITCEPRVCVPKNMQNSILEFTHKFLVHSSKRTTQNVLCKDFYWKKMTKHILAQRRRCLTCNRAVVRRHGNVGMSQYVLADTTGERWSIDFTGKNLPHTQEGHKYLLVMVDNFTKFPFAFALKTKSPEEMVNVFESVFLYFGIPKIVHSDNENCFISDALSLFCKTLGVHRTTIAVLNPRANGLVERFNAYINGAMTKTLLAADKWDQAIPLMMWAYRVAPHSVTGYSPFFMMFGRHPRLPITITSEKTPCVAPNAEEIYPKRSLPSIDFVRKKFGELHHAFQYVRKLQQKAAQRNQDILNINRQNAKSRFKIGDYVILAIADKDRANCPAREGKQKPENYPRKWTFPGSAPCRVIGFGDYETVRVQHSNGRLQYVLAALLTPYSFFGEENISLEELRKEIMPTKPEIQKPYVPPPLKPAIGDLCVVYFPECTDLHYWVGRYLGTATTKEHGTFDVYQWYGQYLTLLKDRQKGQIALKMRQYRPGWWDGERRYFTRSREFWRHKEWTNIESNDDILPEHLVTWDFELTKSHRLPAFIIRKIRQHQRTVGPEG
jgi:transposase InsO family protein